MGVHHEFWSVGAENLKKCTLGTLKNIYFWELRNFEFLLIFHQNGENPASGADRPSMGMDGGGISRFLKNRGYFKI